MSQSAGDTEWLLSGPRNKTTEGQRGLPAAWAAKLAPWVGSLWLTVMAGYYSWVALSSVRHPASGYDHYWVEGWLGFAALVAVSHLLLRRVWVTVVWAVFITAVAVGMIILSHQVTAALSAAWLVTLAWAWGDWVMRRMGIKPSTLPVEWVAVALPLGLGLLASVGLALGGSRALSSTGVVVACAALTLARWKTLWDGFGRLRLSLTGWRQRTRPLAPAPARGRSRRQGLLRAGFKANWAALEHGTLVTMLGFVVLINLAWTLVPEVYFDATNYHLAVPKLYLEQHRVVNLPYFSQSYLARLADMLFTLGMALHGQIVAKLLAFAVGIIAALGVYALGRGLGGPRVGIWSAALFYSTPLVSWLCTTTYIDLFVGMFLLGSLQSFLRWREARQAGWLWASGLLAGAAVGAKMNAVFGLPVVGLVLLWDLARARELTLKAKVKSLGGYVVMAGLIALPWFALVYAFTGNPFFPVLTNIFSGARGALSTVTQVGSQFGVGTSMRGLLRLPFALTFDTGRFDEIIRAGGVGVSLALFPLSLTLLAKRRAAAGLLVAVCVAYLAAWALTFQYARYYLPLLPVIVVLAITSVAELASAGWLRRLNFAWLGVMLLAQVLLIPPQFFPIVERVPFLVTFGFLRPETFLDHALTVYPAARYVNRKIEPGKKVLGVAVENMRFYLDAPLETVAATPGLGQMLKVDAPADLAPRLVKDGFAYLVAYRVTREKDTSSLFLSPWFLNQYASLEYTRNGVEVYHLYDSPVKVPTSVNLLVNSSFEAVEKNGQPTGWGVYGAPRVGRGAAGAHSGEVFVEATVDRGFVQEVRVQGGQLYTLGHFTRADRPGQSARLQINWHDARGQLADISFEIIAVTTHWGYHQMMVNAPEKATSAVVYVSVSENNQVWFDDLWFGAGARRK